LCSKCFSHFYNINVIDFAIRFIK
jgi:hypothetical protein